MAATTVRGERMRQARRDTLGAAIGMRAASAFEAEERATLAPSDHAERVHADHAANLWSDVSEQSARRAMAIRREYDLPGADTSALIDPDKPHLWPTPEQAGELGALLRGPDGRGRAAAKVAAIPDLATRAVWMNVLLEIEWERTRERAKEDVLRFGRV